MVSNAYARSKHPSRNQPEQTLPAQSDQTIGKSALRRVLEELISAKDEKFQASKDGNDEPAQSNTGVVWSSRRVC